jgi:N-acetylglucosaminyl-diphospho-decaprenol L-rhamnosyltransferase
MSAPPSLDIVIVNWNAGALLRRCLTALPGALDPSFVLNRVVVVDNASSDGSLDGLEMLPLPITVLRNASNRGFGAACNQGAANSVASHLLFLNPDVYVQRDSLSAPAAFLADPAHADVGVVGIQLRDGHGTVSRSSARVPTAATIGARILGLDVLFPGRVPSLFLTEWDHDTTRELDHVIGAFYFVRTSLFRRVGGFDERFFVYLEDLDLSVRIRTLGQRIFFLATVHAEHTGGGTSDAIKARRIAYSLHSRIQYGYKHFGRVAGTLLALGTLVVEPGPRLVRAIARRSLPELRDTCVGFALLWGRVIARLGATRPR